MGQGRIQGDKIMGADNRMTPFKSMAFGEIP